MRRIESIVPLMMLAVAALMALLVGPKLLRQYAVAEQAARIQVAHNELSDDDILRRIDRAVAAIADAVEPSVVHIETTGRRTTANGSSGAGWVYDGDGHVVTNSHVVRGATQVSVEFADGVVVGGRVVGTDVYTDIAVVRVDRRDGLFPVRRSEMRLPRVGERVFAFGSPFGFKFSMSEGIVSGLGRQPPGSSIPGGYTNYIQTDAAVNPGNSGGPLINTDGHVVGMNVAIATARSIGSSPEDSGGDSAGISFAIPLGTIEPIVRQLITYGEVSRGYMGISFSGNQRVERVGNENGRALTGVRVSQVIPDGPSDRAGIQADDVVVSIEGSPIVSTEALMSLISSGRPGEPVAVRVWRSDQIVELAVVLDPIEPAVLAGRFGQPIMIRSGFFLADASDGVRITRVFEGMPAAVAGLQMGDVITRVNGIRITDASDFFVAAADEGLLTGEIIELRVVNDDGESRTVSLGL
ncbi:MAG: trypsin-like peptidase domain-containing protein [Phycisphaerales bacterium]